MSGAPRCTPGESDGLTRSQAERAFRKLQEAEESSPRPVRGASVPSLDEVTDSLRRRLAVRGARRSYLEGVSPCSVSWPRRSARVARSLRRAGRADWGGTTGAFADPDGYVLEVAHNPGWTVHDDGTIQI
jgi:hypothetical protein